MMRKSSRAPFVVIAGALSGLLSSASAVAASGQVTLPVVYQSPGNVCSDDAAPKPLELADAVRQSLLVEPHLIMAQQDVREAKSDIRAAVAPFLPSAAVSFIDERYVPSNGAGPVIVVGNTVLGGPQTKSGYGSFSLSWNVMNSGRDVAGFHSAVAGAHAAEFGLKSQLADSLAAILQAYADLYEAEVEAANDTVAAALLKQIHQRAQERFRNGDGTTLAIGQARAAALEAEQALNRACRSVADKSAALAQSVGVHIPAQLRLAAAEPLPLPEVEAVELSELGDVIERTPAVTAAKEKVAAAEAKLQQARRSFGPSITLTARRDYLGQDTESFARANHIAPSDYRFNLGIEQPLFPIATEVAAVDKAHAELRRAQAAYDQARLEVETKLRGAISARREAEASYRAAQTSLDESQQVLALTQSLYQAGRTDLDNVQHAQIDRDKAASEARTLESRRASARWLVARALRPTQFADALFAQLHLQLEAQHWRAGDPEPSPVHVEY